MNGCEDRSENPRALVGPSSSAASRPSLVISSWLADGKKMKRGDFRDGSHSTLISLTD